VPGHSIWVVVDGANLYNSLDVAEMIYKYRNMGCGMYGAITIDVTPPNGVPFPVMFDVAVPQNLYIQMTLVSINDGTIDTQLVISGLIADYDFTIYGPADITSITAFVKSIDPTLIVTACKVSIDNSTWLNSVYPTNQNNIFTLTSANIAITT
jgi:hypothetical protein